MSEHTTPDSVVSRFLAKVDQAGPFNNKCGSCCWTWIGAIGTRQKLRFSYKGRNGTAVRVAFELFCGPISDGAQIARLCENRMCVNPSHLILVSHAPTFRSTIEARQSATPVVLSADGEFGIISVRNKHAGNLEIKVSIGDIDKVSPYRWYAVRKRNAFYARSTHNGVVTSMHRLLMSPPEGLVVDHINRDTLDNRRENLRLCTPSQNSYNRPPNPSAPTAYKGVQKAFGAKHPWCATITVNAKRRNLGTFATAREAAAAYDSAAKELHGKFAYLNFPELAR